MAKRIGLARTETLIENLKREISLSSGAGSSTAANITGFGPGWVTTNDCKAPTISNINGVIVTKLFIDLEGNTSKNDVDDVIGNASGGAAYVYKHENAIGGFIESITITCIEAPTTGADDIDFRISTNAALAYDGDASGEQSILANGAAWAIGISKRIGNTDLSVYFNRLTGANVDGSYFYLCSGEAVAGEYGAGKFIVTIVGNEAF